MVEEKFSWSWSGSGRTGTAFVFLPVLLFSTTDTLVRCCDSWVLMMGGVCVCVIKHAHYLFGHVSYSVI